MKTKYIGMRISPDDYKYLIKIAKAYDMSVSAVIRDAIKLLLEEEQAA